MAICNLRLHLNYPARNNCISSVMHTFERIGFPNKICAEPHRPGNHASSRQTSEAQPLPGSETIVALR